MRFLGQGAEAVLSVGHYKDRPCLVKERFVKTYRHPELDKQLTKERIRAETKALARCLAAGIAVPQVYHMDLDERRIYMEYFGTACTVKHYINEVLPTTSAAATNETELGKRIGRVIGEMHTNNIIHGDLTTSNMLLEPVGDDFDEYKLVMIDFGLAHYQQSVEDKGVDLYVLERALLSTHSTLAARLFDTVLSAYCEANANGCKEVVAKFEDVRARGRKRTMVG